MLKFWKNNKSVVRYAVTLFALWQTALVFLAIVSPGILPSRERFTYNDGEKIVNPIFLWNRANFDGAHYLQISRSGYGFGQQAFFPLYPQLIKSLTKIFSGKDLVAAIFISNVSFFLLLLIFYKLIRLDKNDKIARRTLLFLVLFPTSFFFGMAYTESLFLLLVLGSFYAVRKQKWLLAGILGALAANTRIIGVFIFPALLYEWWTQNKIYNLKFIIKNLLGILLAPLGLLAYMRFLLIKYGDPLMFLHVQPFFGAERSGGKIILLYQVFWRYFKMILTTKLDPLYFAVWLEFLVAVGFLGLLYLAYKERIRTSYLIFSVLAYLTPTLSGTFSSLPRYILVLFPCFICLSGITDKILRCVLLRSSKLCLFFIFSLLFVVSVILFFRGYWVS